MKSYTLTSSGCPSWHPFPPVVDVPELAVPVGVLTPLGGLGVGLQTVPSGLQQPPHHLVRELEPLVPRKASVSSRSDLVVHRKGDTGSPRVVGSTSESSACSRPDCCSSARLRPPPGSRERPGGGISGLSNSARPRRTVSAATPKATATRSAPPEPNSRASVPSHNRRCRSVKCGRSASHRRARDSTTASTTPSIADKPPTPRHKQALLLRGP